jgi:neurotransmitter:Na+ symporter, NSS family
MATVGSAVGLGNIWKFPYITGEYGGGAFVLVYLACIALIGLPIMMAEIMLGRRGRQSPINTMLSLSQETGASRLWGLVGWSGVTAGFLILSYYSVIAGWALVYIWHSATGLFTSAGAEEVGQTFERLVSSPLQLLALHTLFMVMTMVVVARGVRHGLEKAVRLLMPALFALLFLLVFYAMTTGAFMQGLRFLFEPNFSELSATGVLVAMGHAFFTLSLGMGAIMVYGSYMPHKASIATASVMIVAADTLVALLAGMAIFPIVFANGLEPGAGPGLVFQTLPLAFGHMPAGALFGTLFFILLAFAAWSSAISLIEPAVAWLVENRGVNRVKSAVICGIGVWLLGFGTILSFNRWSEYEVFGRTFFGVLDFLTSNIMLPLGGLFVALFAAWVLNREISHSELAIRSTMIYTLWRFLVRYIAPVAVIIVFLNMIGVIH